MSTTVARETSGAAARRGGARRGWTSWVVAVVALLALTAWAATAGQEEQAPAEHPSPGTVKAVDGSDFAVVTLTRAGAEEIGLELARVDRVDHPAGTLAVPYQSLVYGPDGTVWVYVSAADPLQFRRQVVEVAAVDGLTAILTSGPGVGTQVAGTGAAELYGTEFEVGH